MDECLPSDVAVGPLDITVFLDATEDAFTSFSVDSLLKANIVFQPGPSESAFLMQRISVRFLKLSKDKKIWEITWGNKNPH